MAHKIFYTSIVLFIVCVTQAIYSPELLYSASLQWQSNEENDLAGYNVYCTSSEPDHDLIITVGNVTEFDLNGLTLYENEAYVIALTAYDLSGNESGFSDPLYLTLDDRIDTLEDNCPDIYNPNQEDSNSNGIGDVCETILATSSTTIPTIPPAGTTTIPPAGTTAIPPASMTTIPPASMTTIPPASTTTTITECELDSDCPDDELYCNGDEFCDEGTCVSSGNPCEAELICDEATDECKPMAPPVTLQLTPESWYQSRWVSLIKFLKIEVSGSHFDRSLTEVAFTPDVAAIMLSRVIDETTINCIGILMPRWWAPVDVIDVMITTGTEVATATMKIKLLPLLLEQENNTWWQE